MKNVFAATPLFLRFPERMEWCVREVLNGEYEAGYDGEDLSIVDIGANVGAFTLWAHLRWPNSRIEAWEPHPGTFQMLLQNVSTLSNVTCHNAGLLPGRARREKFFSSYSGDGESGFVCELETTFPGIRNRTDKIIDAQAYAPIAMAACDVLKIDVEGAEADILEHARLDTVSLIVLEYQNNENRRRIKELLAPRFDIVYEDEFPWSDILDEASEYRAELRNDHWGHLFFASRDNNKLRKRADWPETEWRQVEWPAPDTSTSDAKHIPARQLLAGLPGAIRRSVAHRLRNRPD